MSKLLKDLYNENYIHILATNITLNHSTFNTSNFTNKVFDKLWKDRELKQRMRHISNTLYDFLPQEYQKSIDILKSTFFKMNHSFMLENMIFQDFVEVYGIEYFEISMDALECFTINSSSEFAIRQFIIKYPDKTMAQMKLWAKNTNEHIRRLSCEGCRPRLPWAVSLQNFKENPEEILKILDILKNDESNYVRKSVANNLNDISKDNPQIIKKIAQKWIGTNDNINWIIKHGCRTLLKNADEESLRIFGFIANKDIYLSNFTLEKKIKMGEELEFSFSLNSKKNLGKLRVEYSITFVRQNHKSSTKVFKIAEGDYKYKSKKFIKRYSFKKISTRKYYKGVHKLNIIINGLILDEKKFSLI